MTAAPLEAYRIASLWRRWLASLLDALPFLLLSLPFMRPSRGEASPKPRRGLTSLVTVVGSAYQISTTSAVGQTFGQMATGIQVVDQDTAALPTLRQSAARWAMTFIPNALSSLVSLPALTAKTQRSLAAMEELQPEAEHLRRQHRGDQRMLNEALMALYQERGVNPLESCMPLLLRALPGLLLNFIIYGPALQGPLHQGLHGRVAKTVVIERGHPLHSGGSGRLGTPESHSS